jgi:membrane associated rhomboid family serine protease
MSRVPYCNFGVIGITCLIHLWLVVTSQEITEKMVIEPWILWVGHVFLHASFMHLIGNMLFLWVFGNAICAKVGNLAYAFVYLGLGVTAAMVHLIIDGRPGIGASGAINGVVGMFLIWYVLNEVSCLYLFGYTNGTFTVSSGWMILLWFAFDIWGAVRGGERVAYWAHVGGFLAGVVLASLLLALGLVKMSGGERSLFAALYSGRPGTASRRTGRRR